MSAGFDVREVAARIVTGSAGPSRSFPLDVELAALGLPVHVEIILDLSPIKIDRWLHRTLDWPIPATVDSRHLRGCLIAHRGHGLIFLEEAESPDERRFTLSHELAHFIGHYLAARSLAIARMGPSIIAVLDGERPPTPSERLSGVLARCPLGVYRDVMGRDGAEVLTTTAERIESEADAAAFQALAPPPDVAARCTAAGRDLHRSGVLETLQRDFGLAYADAINHLPVVLQYCRQKPATLVESLRAAALKSGNGSGRSI